MPLVKRSYEKQENSLDGKNFVSRNLYGDYIDRNPFCYGYDVYKGTRNLTKQGKWLIKTFIEQNKQKEEALKKEEIERWKLMHGKNPPRPPLWKSGLHTIEYFGGPLIDYKYEFIKPKTERHLVNQPPFRRPKEKGDYINKDIQLLGAPEHNY
jgi:hypothetical protein